MEDIGYFNYIKQNSSVELKFDGIGFDFEKGDVYLIFIGYDLDGRFIEVSIPQRDMKIDVDEIRSGDRINFGDIGINEYTEEEIYINPRGNEFINLIEYLACL